jgi:hypothetical protein
MAAGAGRVSGEGRAGRRGGALAGEAAGAHLLKAMQSSTAWHALATVIFWLSRMALRPGKVVASAMLVRSTESMFMAAAADQAAGWGG